jgi:hypothetical protein
VRRGPKELLVLFGVASRPTTFLIGRDGRVVTSELHGEKLAAGIERQLKL